MSDSGEPPIPGCNPEEASQNGSLAHDRREKRASQNAEVRSERRKTRRVSISAPVRVRGACDESGGADVISMTVDVSRHGFLLLSARPAFSQGTVVAVTFPYSKSALAVQAEQPGRVVRVSALADGRFAVAIGLGFGKTGPDSAKRADDSRAAKDRPQEPAERPLVVVVDADVQVRDSLKDALSAEGYEAIAIPGAKQAHALLNQLLPALLIAEIEGEDLPGLDLCARIKSTPRLKGVPVVLTTRSAYPTDYSNAHSLGAIVCIAKPFRPERVCHIVRLLLPSGEPNPQQ